MNMKCLQSRFIFFSAMMVLFCFSSSLLYAKCPEGTYKNKGWNPGWDMKGPVAYDGLMTVKTAGELCEVHWQLEMQKFSGIGIYDEKLKLLSVSYAELEHNWFGIVVYKVEGNTLTGDWGMFGDKKAKLGKEINVKFDDKVQLLKDPNEKKKKKKK